MLTKINVRFLIKYQVKYNKNHVNIFSPQKNFLCLKKEKVTQNTFLVDIFLEKNRESSSNIEFTKCTSLVASDIRENLCSRKTMFEKYNVLGSIISMLNDEFCGLIALGKVVI